MRVAGGAVARLVIPEVTIEARVVEIGGEADAAQLGALLDEARAAGDSLGAVVECVATGVPAGWGAPVYAKLDAELAAAMHGHQRGQGRRDRRGLRRGAPSAASSRRNARRGMTAQRRIDGGISTGQPIVVRRVSRPFKPTSSIGGQGPPRPLRRHPRRAGGRGDDGAGAGRPQTAAPRAVRVAAPSQALVAFEPVERLQAVAAAPLRLARGRAEAADFLGVGRSALRAGRGLGEVGRGDAVGVELGLALRR